MTMAYYHSVNDDSTFQNTLNSMGAEGWEIVSHHLVQEDADQFNRYPHYRHHIVWKRTVLLDGPVTVLPTDPCQDRE